jgi:hypothetical protein
MDGNIFGLKNSMFQIDQVRKLKLSFFNLKNKVFDLFKNSVLIGKS